MTNRLAIDPGKRMCGWALMDGRGFKDCGLARTKQDNIVLGAMEMAAHMPNANIVVIEKMRVYSSPKIRINPAVFIDISIVSGVIAGCKSLTLTDCLFPFANEWKKNLPKGDSNAIIEGLVPEAVKIMDDKKIANSYRNHVWDAIGIGLWSIEQKGKKT
jgi:hypothetical protein